METKADKVRKIAAQLKNVSVSSNGNSSTLITKRDLENFRNKVAEAIAEIANLMDD